MNLSQIKIDPEFRDLIYPLPPEELDQLRENVKDEEGCHCPLVVWMGHSVLIDGHHRHQILSENPTLAYTVVEKAFETRDDVKIWILNNQFGRRNLTPFQFAELRLKLEPLIAAKAKVARLEGNAKGGRGKSSQNSDETSEPVSTKHELARAAGVSHDTIHKVKRVTESGVEELKEAARKGEISINAAAEIATLEPERQRAAVASPKTTGALAREVKKDRQEKKRQQKAETRRQAAAEASKKIRVGNDWGVKDGDFRTHAAAMENESVDLIFTDPPYDRETLPLYGDLAREAARILKPGGSLICYLGQYQIHEVCRLMTPHLRLWWTLACLHTGKSARMNEYGIVVKWKPMLWFVKGTRGDKETFVDDLIESRMEKDTHEWQQGVVEAEYYIDKLTLPGGLVFDPFCGGGTTAVAAKRINRRWITCEINDESAKIARARIQEAVAGEVANAA